MLTSRLRVPSFFADCPFSENTDDKALWKYGSINTRGTQDYISIYLSIWCCGIVILSGQYQYLGTILYVWEWRNIYPYHDDVIKWKYFSRYWPFVREFTGEFTTHRPVTQSFDVLFDLSPQLCDCFPLSTYGGVYKMSPLLPTFPSPLPRKKCILSWLKMHWNVFTEVQLTITRLVTMMPYRLTRLHWVKLLVIHQH